MKNLLKTITLFVCLVLCTQCSWSGLKNDPKPKEPKLPAETASGLNTFGCRVNGQVFVPKGSPFNGPVLSASYTRGNVIFVDAINRSTNQSMQIKLVNVSVVGTYSFNDTTSHRARFRDTSSETECEYLTNNQHTGWVEITKLDVNSRIIAGRFAFKAYSSRCQTVEVTEGRFDVIHD